LYRVKDRAVVALILIQNYLFTLFYLI